MVAQNSQHAEIAEANRQQKLRGEYDTFDYYPNS